MKIANCLHAGMPRTLIETDRGFELLPVGSGDAVAVAMSGSVPAAGEPVDVDAISFLTPSGPSSKLLCVGLNYRDHAAEAAASADEYPSFFIRFWDSVVPHRAAMTVPSNSEKYDFEGELAIIIGKAAHHVTSAEALAFVAGYTCFADNSVRDFQSHSRQVTAGKNFPNSGACGPWVATADTVDADALRLTTRLNGTIVQDASTGDLTFGVAALVSYVSSFTKLLPGDVIATGTPAGVGALRKPQLWMKAGDTLEIEIPGVGHLINAVVAEHG